MLVVLALLISNDPSQPLQLIANIRIAKYASQNGGQRNLLMLPAVLPVAPLSKKPTWITFKT
jgi:hypothetical protein